MEQSLPLAASAVRPHRLSTAAFLREAAASAGTGKTQTMANRVLYMIQEGVLPSKILALTFTNKAAVEFKERIQHVYFSHARRKAAPEVDIGRATVATFHALGIKWVGLHQKLLGFKRRPVIYSTKARLGLPRKSTTTLREVIAAFKEAHPSLYEECEKVAMEKIGREKEKEMAQQKRKSGEMKQKSLDSEHGEPPEQADEEGKQREEKERKEEEEEEECAR
ncbi:hypothetical protein CBR_g26524 [Chara braunii]|uniref:UvrD-like helicase ATP-binding domain-containing protein n=1 Tax=Chara braunii TaxID=69332 RepID=A0A388L858_CHABU|nr:hypothetical protein CBR_g26524 [Chara braunii]|eukprot:GBG78495.1 hypothetical protein CBR_g26524 [Chara braunii]